MPGPKRNSNQSEVTTNAARPAYRRPFFSESDNGLSLSSPAPVAAASVGSKSPSLGSMILSVTNQITGRKTTVMPTMKNQLPAIFAEKSPKTAITLASVMPKSSASSWPGNRFAEKPPETPANAAAIPAIGWRPAA